MADDILRMAASNLVTWVDRNGRPVGGNGGPATVTVPVTLVDYLRAALDAEANG